MRVMNKVLQSIKYLGAKSTAFTTLSQAELSQHAHCWRIK